MHDQNLAILGDDHSGVDFKVILCDEEKECKKREFDFLTYLHVINLHA